MAVLVCLLLAGLLQLGQPQQIDSDSQDTCRCSDMVVTPGKEEFTLKIRTQCNNTELAEKVDMLSEKLMKLITLYQPGRTPNNPATSCREILDFDESTPSDYYWLKSSNGSSVPVYCDMTRSCKGVTGPWMKVAMLDMTNSEDQCPPGLRQVYIGGKRLCGINSDEGACSSVLFDNHGIEYSQVCGKIIGYQDKTTDSFYYLPRTIDEIYVDGVSLTHGSPRNHIWTFSAALDEAGTKTRGSCPCTVPQASRPPSYVGNDYFCDTGSQQHYSLVFYGDNPLWDGQGCGPNSTCCSFNNPPWFRKQLPSVTGDDIEMRVCCNEPRSNEDVLIETVELYVQ